MHVSWFHRNGTMPSMSSNIQNTSRFSTSSKGRCCLLMRLTAQGPKEAAFSSNHPSAFSSDSASSLSSLAIWNYTLKITKVLPSLLQRFWILNIRRKLRYVLFKIARWINLGSPLVGRFPGRFPALPTLSLTCLQSHSPYSGNMWSLIYLWMQPYQH